jgi:hypothetical protein
MARIDTDHRQAKSLGATANTGEAAIKSGKWEHGRPLLNIGG